MSDQNDIAAYIAKLALTSNIRDLEIDRKHYVITPIMRDGSRGPPFEFRELFEQFLMEAGLPQRALAREALIAQVEISRLLRATIRDLERRAKRGKR